MTTATIIEQAIQARIGREGLADMLVRDVDLETMAAEIAEALDASKEPAHPENSAFGCIDCGSLNHTTGDVGWCSSLRGEVERLRAVLRRVQKSPGCWAGLSFPGGIRWDADEEAVIRRAGLTGRHERDTNEAVSDG